jgi:outer membrane protein assembly factor BamD
MTMQIRMGRVAVIAAVLCFLPVFAYAQWTWTPQTGRFVNIKKLPKETAELQIEYARSRMVDGDYKEALQETAKFRNYYRDSPLADQNQFLRGEIRMAQGKPVDAAREFQQVVTEYPNSSLYDQVIKKQYEIGDKLFDQGKAKMKKKFRVFRKKPFKTAIEVYSMVIDNQPFTDAAAEAQYKVGLCHQMRKEYTQAAFEYRRVVEDYASSDWVDDASYGLAMCYYEASRPPEYDQSPSQLAVSAIDDFKRRFPQDERIAALEEKRKEMRESMASQRLKAAQFYVKRRDFTAARIYYQLVADGFGDTGSADKARKWLADNPPAEPSAAEKVLRSNQKTS